MRDVRFVNKFLYILIESPFYEPFENLYNPSTEFTHIVQNLLRKEINSKWDLKRNGIWYLVMPKGLNLPLQGWKIHVSATPLNAGRILEKTAQILIKKKTAFKFVLDKRILSMMNHKNWDRGSSGKFITIYPNSGFPGLIEKLYEELKCEIGPYILSDKRYKDCKVLYYRYGGFRWNTKVTSTGEKVPVLISPDGISIPDMRTPYFNPPYWAKDPFPKDENIQQQFILKNGRYLIQRALHFSNTGGVYLAVDKKRKNKKVVIKEARPYTGIEDTSGEDAISRLKKEYEILELLKKTGVAPSPVDLFEEWEHLFLVEEYIEGVNLRELILSKNPLVLVNPSFSITKKYYKIFIKVFTSFINNLIIVHEKGIILGDLAPQNLIINPRDYSVKFIDFEASFRPSIDNPSYLFTFGFRNITNVLNKTQNFKDDLNTVGMIMCYFLFPIAVVASLKKSFFDSVVRVMLKDLGWPRKTFMVIKKSLTGKISNNILNSLKEDVKLRSPAIDDKIKSDEIKTMIVKMGKFILNNIETHRDDRLFPADQFLYRTNPMSLGFGACGVIYALAKCGFEISRKARLWLEEKFKTLNLENYPPGMLTGLAGISWCLWDIGYEEKSIELIKLANTHPLLLSHPSLFYGMAGVGMTNLYLYFRTKEYEYLNKAVFIGEELLEKAKRTKKGICWIHDGEVYIGYGYGQSGIAMFLLRLYQLTGDRKYFLNGKRALDFDISHAKELEKGVITFPDAVNNIKAYEPYLEAGSGGVVKVFIRYGYWEKIHNVINDLHRKYSVFAGLLFGNAGFVDVFIDAYLFSNDDKYLQMAKRPIQGIKQLFLLKRPQGFAIPGDSLLRISCDYGTGVAGVMRTLHRYMTKDQADFVLDEVAVK